jgi:hypothetical protein
MKRSDISTFEVLSSIQDPEIKKPYEHLIEKYNAPEKIVFRAFERDYDKGYLEYGVSLCCSWLTDLGIKYLTEKQQQND